MVRTEYFFIPLALSMFVFNIIDTVVLYYTDYKNMGQMGTFIIFSVTSIIFTVLISEVIMNVLFAILMAIGAAL